MSKSSGETRNQTPAALLAGLVLLSRLPFLFPGYGHDSDAWRVVQTARYISETGQYGASRLPGHPVQEILYSLLWRGGELAVNGATAILSAGAIWFFALAMKRLKLRDPLLAGLALAAIPVVYINSTNALDYLWALAFSMGALHSIASRRMLAAGIWLGIAIGARISAAGLWLPLVWLLLAGIEPRRRLPAAVTFSVTAFLIGTLCYLPVFLEYGPAFLRAYQSAYPHWVLVGKQATVDVWGLLGLLAVATAVVALGLRALLSPASLFRRVPEAGPLLAASSLAILIYSVSYAALPHDSGYLIPALPFVLIAFAMLLPAGLFRLVCVLICLSPFLFDITDPSHRPRPEPGPLVIETRIAGWPLAFEPLRGPVLYDHARRRAEHDYVERVLARAAALPGNNVVVAYDWLPQIQLTAPPSFPEEVRFVYLLDRSSYRALRRDGVGVHYLAAANIPNALVYGFELENAGAVLLDSGDGE